MTIDVIRKEMKRNPLKAIRRLRIKGVNRLALKYAIRYAGKLREINRREERRCLALI